MGGMTRLFISIYGLVTKWCLFLAILTHQVHSNYQVAIDNLPADQIVVGDIHIGLMQGGMKVNKLTRQCYLGKASKSWQFPEAAIYAIEKINKNQSILPGIKLGFTGTENCQNSAIATSLAQRFKPANSAEDVDAHLKVVAMVFSGYSSRAMNISNVLSKKNIPQISVDSSSDALSNATAFPYFFRVIPGDLMMVEVVMGFMNLQNWTYFSVVYSNDTYGREAWKAVDANHRNFGLCVSNSFLISETFTEKHYRQMVSKLLDDSDRARVVFAITQGEMFQEMLEVMHTMNVESRLIFIGADDVNNRLRKLTEDQKRFAYGMFTSMFHNPKNEELRNHLGTLKPSTSNNRMFATTWEYAFKCSFDKGTCDESKNIMDIKDYSVYSGASYVFDAVKAIALALESIRKEQCSGKSLRETINCIVNYAHTLVSVGCSKISHKLLGCLEPGIIKHLRLVSFEGITGMVHFDENGDRNTAYDIFQFFPDKQRLTKTLRIEPSGSIKVTRVEDISWRYEWPPKIRRVEVDFSERRKPLSACFVCCGVDERIIGMNSHCCSRLTSCDFEAVKTDREHCEVCAGDQWPDKKSNYSECGQISHHLISPYPIVIVALSGLGIFASFAVLLALIIYRNTILVKTWSRELSGLIIWAILMGFVTNVVLFAPKTRTICAFRDFSDTWATTGLYTPLLLKTVRVYRVFRESNKGRRGMKFVSPMSQISTALSVISFQLLIHAIFANTKPMPSVVDHPSDYILLYCSPGGIEDIIFNVTNVILIVICTVFAHKNRNLPAFYRESHHTHLIFLVITIFWYFLRLFLPFSGLYEEQFINLTSLLNFLYFASALFILFFVRMTHLVVFISRSTRRKEIAQSIRSMTQRKKRPPSTVIANSSEVDVGTPVDTKFKVVKTKARKKAKMLKMSVLQGMT